MTSSWFLSLQFRADKEEDSNIEGWMKQPWSRIWFAKKKQDDKIMVWQQSNKRSDGAGAAIIFSWTVELNGQGKLIAWHAYDNFGHNDCNFLFISFVAELNGQCLTISIVVVFIIKFEALLRHYQFYVCTSWVYISTVFINIHGYLYIYIVVVSMISLHALLRHLLSFACTSCVTSISTVFRHNSR